MGFTNQRACAWMLMFLIGRWKWFSLDPQEQQWSGCILSTNPRSNNTLPQPIYQTSNQWKALRSCLFLLHHSTFCNLCKFSTFYYSSGDKLILLMADNFYPTLFCNTLHQTHTLAVWNRINDPSIQPLDYLFLYDLFHKEVEPYCGWVTDLWFSSMNIQCMHRT